jgi:hypothetical protein
MSITGTSPCSNYLSVFFPQERTVWITPSEPYSIYNRKIVETDQIDTPLSQIHIYLLSWTGTFTSINKGGVKYQIIRTNWMCDSSCTITELAFQMVKYTIGTVLKSTNREITGKFDTLIVFMVTTYIMDSKLRYSLYFNYISFLYRLRHIFTCFASFCARDNKSVFSIDYM